MNKYSKKIKIAIIGDDFSRQGKGTAMVIQKITEIFLRNFSNNIDITLIYPEGKCTSSICNKARKVEFKRRLSTTLSYVLLFIQHKEQYDIVIFNRRVYPGFWFLNAKNFILIAHDSPVNNQYAFALSISAKLFDYFVRLIGKYFLRAIITGSEDARKEVIKYYRANAMRVISIYYGVDNLFHVQNKTEKEEASIRLAERYGITVPYILDVSRFDPHKNIVRVLDAFFSLKEEQKISHKLVLVGGRHTAEYSTIVDSKIKASQFANDVLIAKYIEPDDMPALYNLADVLAFPSLLEGFGLPLVEAMRCGTPIVTSNISSMPEIVGNSALLVDPFDAKAIQLALYRIISDTELRLSLISRGLARGALFSWENSAGKFVELFKQL